MPKLKDMIPGGKDDNLLTKNVNSKPAGLANELKESKVGDVYITIGENIENIKKSVLEISSILKKMQDKRGVKQLDTINSMVALLKQKFNDSYSFENAPKTNNIDVRKSKLTVEQLLKQLHKVGTFRQYRNMHAEYDDPIYLDIPYSLLDRYGLSLRTLESIADNPKNEQYGPQIAFDKKKRTVTIYGAND